MGEPETRCAWLDGLIERVDSDSFKILYYLVHRGGTKVSLPFSELKRIGISRFHARKAIKSLSVAGLLAKASPPVAKTSQPARYSVLGMPAIAAPAAPKVKMKANTHWAEAEYEHVWDALSAARRTIAEPLSDSIVRRALEIGDAWKKSGNQVASMLYNRTKFLGFKTDKYGRPLYVARGWIYLLNAIRKGFEDEANTERQMSRKAREQDMALAARVVSIEAPPLPLREDSRDFQQQVLDEIAAQAKVKSLG